MCKKKNHRKLISISLNLLGAGLLAGLFLSADAMAQIEIVQFIDLKCYRIEGEPLGLDLQLAHLNPLLRQLELPPEKVTIQEPQQLCVPVAKNGMIPPALELIQFIDLKCYRIEGEPLGLDLQLFHMNPVLQRMQLPPEQVTLQEPQQLCVPVAKNGLIPPPQVLQFIQFIDLKCYRIEGDPLELDLHLDHLNPILRRMQVPPEDVTLHEPQQLCVPVAKNGLIPPPQVLQLVQFIDQKCYRIEGDPIELDLHLDHLNPILRQMKAPPEDVTLQEPQQLCVPVRKAIPAANGDAK